MSAEPVPVVITPAQRDVLDDLERKAFGRDGRWVPADHLADHVNGHGHMSALVSLGLVEEWCQPDGGGNGTGNSTGNGSADGAREGAGDDVVPSYRRNPDALFVVVLPRGVKPARALGV